MAKQSGGNTAQRVEALVRPTVEGMGLRLWDVVFEKEGPDWYLRVLIDKTDGTTMDTDTCADVSHALDPILDEADPIEQSYYLEVGSPGLGRKLTRPEHYEAVRGQKVSVRLYRANENGVKEFSGLLTFREGNTITLEARPAPCSSSFPPSARCACVTTRTCLIKSERMIFRRNPKNGCSEQ